MTKELESIVANIAIWKLRTGKTDAEILNALDITRNTLVRKRKGETCFTMDEIIGLCELLECSPNELMGY